MTGGCARLPLQASRGVAMLRLDECDKVWVLRVVIFHKHSFVL